MPIQSGDVKLLKSAVMADVPEGGGAPTGITIADGVSNAIFPDISELDRAGGRVNLRLPVLDADPGGHSWPLPRALAALRAAPQGVAVLLNCSQQPDALLSQLLPQADSRPVDRQLDLRTYGVGAQILLELGVTRMKLLGSPRRMPSMTGYGLEVTGFVAAPC